MLQTTENTTTKGVQYMPFNDPKTGITTIQGIRGVSGSENVFISGSLVTGVVMNGLIYEGPLTGEGKDGKWHVINFPSSHSETVTSTSCYGPNNGPKGTVEIVGAYMISSGKGNLGFYYNGPIDGSGSWVRVSPNEGNTSNVFVHSVMGELAVGNYDQLSAGDMANGNAFIYDIDKKECTDIKFPDAIITTLYGIWHNGGHRYTLAGGFISTEFPDLIQAFLVDYDHADKSFSHLKTFPYRNEEKLTKYTHFEGITIADDGGFNCCADFGSTKGESAGAFVHIPRNADGSFGEATWVDIIYPGMKTTGADTVYKNNVLGLIVSDATPPVLSSFNAEVM
jgi:hypothetical protein